MALPGECKGVSGVICGCRRKLKLRVCSSGAGYYLGYRCPCCGPYSRETDYFRNKEAAEKALLNPAPYLR